MHTVYGHPHEQGTSNLSRRMTATGLSQQNILFHNYRGLYENGQEMERNDVYVSFWASSRPLHNNLVQRKDDSAARWNAESPDYAWLCSEAVDPFDYSSHRKR